MNIHFLLTFFLQRRRTWVAVQVRTQTYFVTLCMFSFCCVPAPAAYSAALLDTSAVHDGAV